MKRYTIIAILLSICLASRAQSVPGSDKELESLVSLVKMLRETNEDNFNKASQQLTADTKWTPMDETGNVRQGLECRATEKVPGFKLNRILTKVDGSRKHVSTHGDMVNGEDSRYDYSLFERTLKAKTEVAYRLKGREGQQTFVIVPYDPNASFTAYVTCNGKKIAGKRQPDGTIVLEWQKNLPSRNSSFTLTVKNNTGTPQSFVIINHNTRKK